ncbi:hypothetical protein KP509_16G034200 [Ceratopteris richardii]|uniref:Multidrug and toxic compound extrusion protein n=1 Tax=Ceratopteris richardii TaxID=49495 RepID=A0A8T2SXT7_CERRI|nr:hypothetical protein KP509_16G034200 [Ceratopteris richardii]
MAFTTSTSAFQLQAFSYQLILSSRVSVSSSGCHLLLQVHSCMLYQRLVAPAKDADLYMPKMVDEKRVLPAVSTALLVGALLGLVEFIILAAGSEQILTIMGIPRGSSMEEPAEHFLQLRAVGAPAVVISLTTQGVFRGFKDTKTPLYATAIGNVLNMILVPFFIFFLDYGVTGAAAGNVISQYLTALILLFKMSRNISLIPPKLQDLNFLGFVKYGGLLLIRSTATMLTMTLATSEAARQGVIPMAAHQICMQVWLAASLLSDAIALASQAIIASALARGLYDVAKDAAFRSLKIGCCFGLLISLLLLGFSMVGLSKIFTNDLQVLAFVSLGLPFVIATQPINSLAFVFDGIHFGALDFWYAAKSMVLVAILASMTIFLAARVMGFVGIWIGLSSFMALRMLVGFFRIGTASGPWKFLR